MTSVIPAHAESSNASAWANSSGSWASASASADGVSAVATADDGSANSQVIIEVPPENLFEQTIEYTPVPQGTQLSSNIAPASAQNQTTSTAQPEANASASAQEASVTENLTSRINDIQNKQDSINGSLNTLEDWSSQSQRYYLIGLLVVLLIAIIAVINSISLRRKISHLEV